VHGIDLVSPNAPEHRFASVEDVRKELRLPPPFTDDGPVSKHLVTATFWLAAGLGARNHINLKRQSGFQCVSYYTDAPGVVAYCAGLADGYVAVMGAPFLRRLVKISDLVAPSIRAFIDTPGAEADERVAAEPLEELSELVAGDLDVSQAEADRIVTAWPAPNLEGGELPLGPFALFYDLVRLVWAHEWAHALCGHVDVAAEMLGFGRLHEFSSERPVADVVPELGYPRAEVLQAIESHADEFAARLCVGEILWGHDPVGRLAGPRINLVERMVFFNVACSIFAVVWALQERRYSGEDSFIPPAGGYEADAAESLFVPLRSSHPPAVLRYMRFRDFAGQLGSNYAPELGPLANATTTRYIDDRLSVMSPHFYHLLYVSPGIARTPIQERLIAYERYLLGIGVPLGPLLEANGYVPTADPTG
jgi:hypothetical protein